MSARLLLVRHGLTDWNSEGRFQGHLDPPLSQEGLAQATLLAQRLASSAHDRPARIVSSSLTRALETAQAIRAALGDDSGEVEVMPALMELGQGEWEGKSHSELEQTDAERYAAWRRAGGNRQPPGGEPLEVAIERVVHAIADAVAASAETASWPLCIVAHGGSLRLAAHALLELDLEHAWELEMDNACLCILDREEASDPWRLVTWNDTTHLLGRSAAHAGREEGEPLAL